MCNDLHTLTLELGGQFHIVQVYMRGGHNFSSRQGENSKQKPDMLVDVALNQRGAHCKCKSQKVNNSLNTTFKNDSITSLYMLTYLPLATVNGTAFKRNILAEIFSQLILVYNIRETRDFQSWHINRRMEQDIFDDLI